MDTKQTNSKMASKGYTSTYEIEKIPDPACSQHLAASAGGDVVGAIVKAFEFLLRVLAHMPAGSCSATIGFIFNPIGVGQDRQSRLTLYLVLWAVDRPTARNLDGLLKGGPASRYYEFRPIPKIPDVKGLKTTCRIVRRENFIKPLSSRDLNYKILRSYYSFTPFTANRENDYLILDQVLDLVVESVRITIQVQPVDIATQVQAHAAYLARLAEINNRWDFGDDDFGGIDYPGPDERSHLNLRNQLKPLVNKEPWANEVLRGERENHKTLHKPHLSLCIKTESQTSSTARLISSVLGDCAFKEGSYRIVNEKDKGLSNSPGKVCRPTDAIASGLPQSVDDDLEFPDYKQLRPLGRLATVDELLGAFRLPIGGYFSPSCIRKDTDPPHERRKDLIVLGYDMEIGSSSAAGAGQPRGITLSQLMKHCFVGGVPGSGKSTALMNVFIQLWNGGPECSATD